MWLANLDPHTVNSFVQFERVQGKFLKYVSVTLDIQCPFHNNSPVSTIIDLLDSLDNRIGQTFLIDLL